jgi:hypothetical protein
MGVTPPSMEHLLGLFTHSCTDADLRCFTPATAGFLGHSMILSSTPASIEFNLHSLRPAFSLHAPFSHDRLPSRTPDQYLRARDRLITAYRSCPTQRLTATAARRVLPDADADAVRR